MLAPSSGGLQQDNRFRAVGKWIAGTSIPSWVDQRRGEFEGKTFCYDLAFASAIDRATGDPRTLLPGWGGLVEPDASRGSAALAGSVSRCVKPGGRGAGFRRNGNAPAGVVE